MIFTPSIIKDIGVGVVNGEVIVYPQCPRRFHTMWENGIHREIFKHSNEVLRYFWYILTFGKTPTGPPHLLKDGSMSEVNKRAHLAVCYLLEKYFKVDQKWETPLPMQYGMYTIGFRPFVIEGTTAINVWPVESVHRKGGQLNTSDAGLLKLSDKCFKYPALVLKNEMLMQKYFRPELTHYRIHVIGLDKAVKHPSDEHLILEFEYEDFMDDIFREMMSRVMEVYELMSAKSWPAEEKRYRCRFCPIDDCRYNYKANPFAYKKKYGLKH